MTPDAAQTQDFLVEESEYKELTVSEIKGQIYRLNSMLGRIQGKLEQSKKFLEMSRSVSERTQKLVTMGAELYDLESSHRLRI